jgi:DNA-binding SARP family transcriptional activator/ATP/maltotriose-dependent transcriptional regulator MalT
MGNGQGSVLWDNWAGSKATGGRLGATRDTFRRLPSHHIPRTRLTSACADQPVIVVEAAGGYGKSVLAAELIELWGVLPIWVLLEESGVAARLLVARLRDAVARAGLTDAAGAMAARGDDPSGAIEVMLAALGGETCAIVIDDAHHADRAAAQLIARIAALRGGSVRVVVLARSIPDGAERLRRAEALQLNARDLALRPEETLAICQTGFGLSVTASEARALEHATGGWTAATVLAASRAARTNHTLPVIAALAGSQHDALGAMLEEALTALGVERALLAQIAPPPLLDRNLLAEVTGDRTFFDRALACGLPLSEARGGWWELPGPVRDHLQTLGDPDPGALGRAAAYYEQHGALSAALQLLLGAGQLDAAASLLDEADPRSVEGVEVLELLAVIDRIPQAELERHPRAMLRVAESCTRAYLLTARGALFTRLDAIVTEHESPELRRAVDAGLAMDLVRDGNTASEGEDLARRVLARATPAEQMTRARALSAIARASWWRREDDGQRSVARLREAAWYFDQALEIFRSLGQRSETSNLAVYRAIWSEHERGRAAAALAMIDEALSLAVDLPRQRAMVLLYRADVLIELGRHDEAELSLAEAMAIAAELRDPGYLPAYVHWGRMTSASLRGDAEATLHEAQQTEANRADWWELGSADFLSEAADCLDRVGYSVLAWEYLERARQDPGDAERMIAMAGVALLARHGDPELAQVRLGTVHGHGIAPREYWRVTLLEAYAAYRRGADSAGGLAARAFEEAARLGQPQLPLIRERELTEAMLALAAETGMPAACALQTVSLPATLAVLGRFELTSGGRPVALGAGQGPQLVKLLAASGGRLPADRAIEALWPEVDPSAGRNRLRVVLSRLRDAAGEVVVRDGELLALGPEVMLDVSQFLEEARRALALRAGDRAGAVALARSAIARYRGPLLPHDPYEPWAEEPRERAARTMLDLLDLCADVATDRGDLDETRRVVERTIELAPYDEDRYLRVALILQRQGRRGAALSVLRRARAALAQLGVDPPRALMELEERVAAPHTIRADRHRAAV